MSQITTLHSTTSQVRREGQDGVALITTLLLLTLLMAVSLTMVLSSSSDMLINGYYRNFRGSFYAADSGLNVARQALSNQLIAAVPATFSTTTQPIAPGTETTVQSYMTSQYGSNSSLNAGTSTSSWPESYKITSMTLAAPTCTLVGGTGSCAAPAGAVTGYQYIYNYSFTSQGQSQGSGLSTLGEAGSLILNVTLHPAGGTTTSFAGYGMFIDKYSVCSSTLVPGTISGPVFTNGSWNFGYSGSYIFTDTVGSAGAKAGYQFSDGTCDQVTGTSDKYKGTTIKPTFQNGFNQGQAAVPLPQNDYNQQQAVLDGVGVSATNPNKSAKNAVLKDATGTSYPMSGAATGVFMSFYNNSGTMTMGSAPASPGGPAGCGGGIYVEGDASVTLAPKAGSSSAEVYTIKQGATTTTVTIDPVANTTKITNGAGTQNIAGVPTQCDATTGAPISSSTMLYVNGNITALTGPGEGLPAIQDGTALTVTAASDVTITGDILYKTEPVTTTQNQIVPGSSPACCNGTPADTLIPGNNKSQVLGIFTATGDIKLANTQSDRNLEVDASLATISNGGSGGLVNTGSSIDTLTIVGGRIQNTIQNINSTTRNVFFDRRFAQGGFAPPWFPSTTITNGGTSSATVIPTFQRTQWVNQTSTY